MNNFHVASCSCMLGNVRDLFFVQIIGSVQLLHSQVIFSVQFFQKFVAGEIERNIHSIY